MFQQHKDRDAKQRKNSEHVSMSSPGYLSFSFYSPFSSVPQQPKGQRPTKTIA